jgi:transcriptional regulator with XRE-family HTH domain
LREDKDLNQADVAKIIGTTQQYYGQYEAGKRPIPFDRIITLAKYYNVSIDYIAGLTNDKGGLHNNSKYNITQQNNNSAVIKIKEK